MMQPDRQRCTGRRTRTMEEPGRRRHGLVQLRSGGDGQQRRTNCRPATGAGPAALVALRDLRLLISAFVLAATVALKGGVLASSNPLELNGGSCLAMAGKGCVALAVDRRFGLEGQLVSTEAKRVLKVWAGRDSGRRERKSERERELDCFHPIFYRNVVHIDR